MKMTKNSFNRLRLLVVALGIVALGCGIIDLEGPGGGGSENNAPKIISITLSIDGKSLDITADDIYGKQLIKIEIEAEDESLSSLKFDLKVIRTSDLTDVSDDLISGELGDTFNIKTPDVSKTTEYEIEAVVTDDGGNEDSDSINITVLPNKEGVFFIPPILNLPASQIGASKKVLAIGRKKNGDSVEIDQDSIESDKESVAKVDSVVALKEEDVDDFTDEPGIDLVKEGDYGKGVKIFIDIKAKGIANIKAAIKSGPDVEDEPLIGELLVTVGESVLEVIKPADKTLTVGVGATETIVLRAISEEGNLDLVDVSSDDSGVATGEVTVSDSTNKTHTITVSGISDGDADILIEADSGKDETVAVTVSSDISPDTPSDAITSVAVSPASAAITTGGTVALTATVNGSGSFDSTVNWAVQSGGGTLSANTGPTVTYTAPTSEGNAVVRASAAGDLNKFTDVTITISQASIITSVTISPASASLTTGAAVTLSATVAGTGNFATGINWAITSGGGGLSAFTGPTASYTAPALAGTATVTATAASDPAKSASSSINVFTITGITISPTSAVIGAGDNISLTATLSGTGNFDLTINWSIQSGDGTLSANTGPTVTYTASSTAGAKTIRATSAADPNTFAEATITVAQWQQAGTKVNNFNGISSTLNPKVESGSVYVLFEEGTSPDSTVKRWNESTLTWDNLGVIFNLSLETNESLTIDSDTSTPYVAGVNGCCLIKIFNYTTLWNFYWSYTAQFPAVDDMSIVYSNTDDRLYISYTSTSGSTYVDYFTSPSTPFTTGGASFTGASPSLAISSTGTPHIAYDDGGMIGVRSLNGATWDILGGSGFPGSNPSLVLSSVGIPYVAYRDGNDVKVQFHNGTSFQQLGGNLNTTPSSTSRPSIALDGSGNPYAAFQHGTSEVIVKRWNGSSWVQVGAKLNSNIMAGEYLSIAFDGTTPYVAYTDGPAAGSQDAYVSRFK